MADRTSEPPRDDPSTAPGAVGTADQRAAMVRDQLRARGIRDEAVLLAMGQVPRERFVPLAVRDRAYADAAQSIGRGQTISQPYMVARMTEAIRLDEWRRTHPGEVPRILDVGTGSGYQAAVLAAMGAWVTTIERDEALSVAAVAALTALGISVHAVVGDGSEGHAPDAPYAGIVVAAAAPDVPPPLLEQLADGGRLVIPVGPRDRQELTVVVREGDRIVRRELEPCAFVPLLGRHGQAIDVG